MVARIIGNSERQAGFCILYLSLLPRGGMAADGAHSDDPQPVNRRALCPNSARSNCNPGLGPRVWVVLSFVPTIHGGRPHGGD